MTSSLPRMRSTGWATRALKRETGFEPATSSLEGYHSANWVTPADWAGADSNHRTPKRLGLQPSAINHSTTCPSTYVRFSWRRDLNPRPADYKSAALPTELRQHKKKVYTTTIFGLSIFLRFETPFKRLLYPFFDDMAIEKLKKNIFFLKKIDFVRIKFQEML